MALTDILDQIVQEANTGLDKLEKDFSNKKKKLEDNFKDRQKEIDEDLHQRVEENSKKIIEKAETLAKMEGKSSVLKAKREFIAQILTEATEELAKSEKYEQILTDMLQGINVSGSNIVVIPAKGKEETTKAAIKAAGKDYFLSDKSANIKGGFILKTDKIEIDNSFETIINKQLREDFEITLNKTLF